MKKENEILKVVRYFALLLVVGLGLVSIIGTGGGGGGGSDGGGGGGDAQVDPYEDLMALDKGEVDFEGEYGCFRDCDQTGHTICVTRNTSEIISSLNEGYEFTEACDQLLFPEWFYQYDCHIATGGIHGITGYPLEYISKYYEEGETFNFFVQCFCGRTSNTFSSQYSYQMLFKYNGCGEIMTDFDQDIQALLDCSNPCIICEPNCAGRECGPDGCGAFCGTCSGGEECNAAGQCVTEADTCTSCLQSCSGLPGCCVGCGCMCEDECGGCFYF